MSSCPKNATYLSKTSQNDLLECMGQYIQSQIIADVKQSKYYGIMADEVTDISSWEQLGVTLHYIKDSVAHEKLVQFVACESITGKEICVNLVNLLQRVGLDPQCCRAQTYDGAGSMSGRLNGCQAKFREIVPKALYFHCSSHKLNLVLSKASSVSSIHCMLSDLKSLGIFFKYSPKRQRHLETSVDELNSKKAAANESLIPKLKLKLLCETRWVECHTALNDFNLLYEAVVYTLESISINIDKKWDAKSVTEANSLLHAITSDSFIVAFQTNLYFFGYTKGLSVLLQGSHLDILTAFEEVASVKQELRSIRDQAELDFKTTYKASIEMAQLAGKDELSRPRCCGRQVYRNNTQTQTPEDYWRVSVFIPFLDSILTELDARFTPDSKERVQGLLLLPKYLDQFNDDKISLVKRSFSEDMPQSDIFEQEVRIWKRKWQTFDADLPQNLAAVLDSFNKEMFPDIYVVLSIACIIPVTTATVERSNSALKYVKTALRSIMGQERLNSLLLLFIHKNISLDYEAIINSFASKHPRRMLLSNPLAGL